MRRARLVPAAAAALVAAWCGGAPRPAVAAAPSPEYSVAGHAIRVVADGDACAVEHRRPGAEPRRLELALRPPCYLLVWQRPPPASGEASGASGGTPVGGVGDPMAWRYEDAGDDLTVLAVLGDPVPDGLRGSSLYRLRERQQLRCAASAQAVLVGEAGIRLSRKREQVGVLCAELGLGEADFWLLAHP